MASKNSGKPVSAEGKAILHQYTVWLLSCWPRLRKDTELPSPVAVQIENVKVDQHLTQAEVTQSVKKLAVGLFWVTILVFSTFTLVLS